MGYNEAFGLTSETLDGLRTELHFMHLSDIKLGSGKVTRLRTGNVLWQN